MFGHVAGAFNDAFKKASRGFKRVDIVFLRYFDVQIKSGTREVRNNKATPIKKKLDEERHILIPVKWENFMVHTENKEDLAKFISREVLINTPED